MRAKPWVILLIVAFVAAEDNDLLEDSSVTEYRGYFNREHSLLRPYTGHGMDVPYWDITGSTMVTAQQIRLTPNLQGRQGAIWSQIPVQSRDWELMVTFRIHGDTGKLFGDGIGIWYTRDRNIPGPVFGSTNGFSGLGVFLDTYHNDYSSYAHTFPYIYAMVSDGTVLFNGDKDGGDDRLGGSESGCEVKFRNVEYDTHVLIRYVGDTLTVYQDTENTGKWHQCLRVGGVHLPTGYYFGLSAATGDLSDNHDITAVRMFEIEYSRAENINELDPSRIQPKADYVAPRDHVSNPPPSQMSTWGKYLLITLGVCATVGGIAVFGYLWYQDRQSRSRKRFY
ncbi:unnamed protein product [Bursaphelenchus xylophilus]|uniref:(pine wood nematode) hypothetical protein n=1 Tax=Bursaphelenchus xylophilus TaxID=6326 RepID=A0A1I7SQ54_BURXY|nr:unnamed protein product [Bursaphelenchus xylophilus]CAG9109621.1 unnamed protein product [Bursaphelenchus xylophilus]